MRRWPGGGDRLVALEGQPGGVAQQQADRRRPAGPAGSSRATISSCTATSTAVAVRSLVTDASGEGPVGVAGDGGRCRRSRRQPAARCAPGQPPRPSSPSSVNRTR